MSPPRRTAAARWTLLLALTLAACAGPPPASVETPYGQARAATQDRARQLALLLSDLTPRVRELLPDALERDTEVWLDDFPGLTDRPDVVGLAAPGSGRIRIRADRLGRDADFVLVHELVHALLGPSWEPLPSVMKEGLCDAVARRLAPTASRPVTALRLFDALTAYPGAALELAYFEPVLGSLERLPVPLADRTAPDPFTALQQPGPGVHLRGLDDDDPVLYGYGLLVVERILERRGLAGLHALCRQAGGRGLDLVPLPWILEAAELQATPESWRRAALEAVDEEVLAAQCDQLAGQLTGYLVNTLRHRYPGLDGQAFLTRALPTVGWAGAAARVALGTVPGLREQLPTRWALSAPATLRPGDGWWLRDERGLHLTSLIGPGPDETAYTISRLSVPDVEGLPGLPGRDLGLPDPRSARLDLLIRIGRDAGGLWVRSSAPDGLEAFRVERDGVLLVDLERGLGVVQETDERGWPGVRARLPLDRDLAGMVLFHELADLVISQRLRGQGPGREQLFPLWLPGR